MRMAGSNVSRLFTWAWGIVVASTFLAFGSAGALASTVYSLDEQNGFCGSCTGPFGTVTVDDSQAAASASDSGSL
jgi:hypothetical protein